MLPALPVLATGQPSSNNSPETFEARPVVTVPLSTSMEIFGPVADVVGDGAGLVGASEAAVGGGATAASFPNAVLTMSFSLAGSTMFTDVVLPGISGKELADKLRELRPDLKILYTSGYTENTIAHQGVVDAGLHFLAKPYLPSALVEKIRAVLDGA